MCRNMTMPAKGRCYDSLCLAKTKDKNAMFSEYIEVAILNNMLIYSQ